MAMAAVAPIVGLTAGITAARNVTGGLISSFVGAAGPVATPAEAAGTMLGPVGWMGIGAEKKASYTFDCRKPIGREFDTMLSKGHLLFNLILDPRIKKVDVFNAEPDALSVIVGNIWNEKFRLVPVRLDDGTIAAHAETIGQAWTD